MVRKIRGGTGLAGHQEEIGSLNKTRQPLECGTFLERNVEESARYFREERILVDNIRVFWGFPCDNYEPPEAFTELRIS